MATGELHEVSAKIGALDAKTDMVVAAQTAIFGKLDAIHERLGQVDAVTQRVERVEPLVDKHERAHQRQKGVTWAVAGMASAAVTIAAEWVRAKFGGHS